MNGRAVAEKRQLYNKLIYITGPVKFVSSIALCIALAICTLLSAGSVDYTVIEEAKPR